ncbi:beta-ketoacyl-[acyl-carrier-protein] synthase II [Pseudomonas protegens]|jgi:3-oxoacyl-[acyl-carrier-protein] synthase II|uniref:3-oxoacyl-[acyl-carrier-protein] synthase 2 n=4 Tax=Pseudomonas protegens TaxID=380021 RepID=Q4KB45_PSEF5|nr:MULTISPECIES: beta-ketoacyl-ACP synthase II [Pseudomonas]AAY92702.1 beta-ketoacyl-acyl-carrier-protein synthase II [Pseudomonas protegens Pf-5]ASE23113.1 beta-ketoacyl-[acyl-carrier-protein] synthase II [Pseudomonas protegens]MBP5098747.1 beta-ketoacyl-ACP synthase II [Pseudomonas protegens]MBP5132513.1 beta-ketoacyl-ACP synthase II [Pseudomonas protegens]MBP5150531.1 beta-ketoacyl-ACP synthase II [Pseudomonas protegens]
MSKRIVVTGMGAITPLGCGVEQVWRRLLAGQSGIRSLPEELIGELSTTIGGQVPDSLQDPEAGFDPDQLLAPKEQRKMDRFILFALAAAEEALAQAGWKPDTAEAQERTATIIASGVGGFPAIAEAVRTTDSKGPRRLSPFTIPSFLSNMAAGHVSIRHGLKGPLGAPVTACAAGVQAIGDAARMIRAGEIDIAVCGGAEAAIHRVSLGGFAAARALSSEFNDTPERASRPFDQARDGFVMGEGAGLLVIEELEHALARGARPIAELVGYGTSADAYHMTAGPEDGDGARRAMQQALRQAGIQASQVQHLNAHATSTPVGDKGELAAIRTVFGTDSGLAISATKSATGHLLGAAGGIEAIFTILALRDQIAPATLNLENPDSAAAGLDLVRGQARQLAMQYALSNGFGFGGVNASVLFKRWE